MWSSASVLIILGLRTEWKEQTRIKSQGLNLSNLLLLEWSHLRHLLEQIHRNGVKKKQSKKNPQTNEKKTTTQKQHRTRHDELWHRCRTSDTRHVRVPSQTFHYSAGSLLTSADPPQSNHSSAAITNLGKSVRPDKVGISPQGWNSSLGGCSANRASLRSAEVT